MDVNRILTGAQRDITVNLVGSGEMNQSTALVLICGGVETHTHTHTAGTEGE